MKPILLGYEEYYAWKYAENCLITLKYIAASDTIFGPNVSSLTGKIVIKLPKHLKTDLIRILFKLLELNKHMVVESHVLFVNGLPFVVSMPQKLRLNMAEHVKKCT